MSREFLWLSSIFGKGLARYLIALAYLTSGLLFIVGIWLLISFFKSL
jgi:hypothetical protein